MSGDAQQFSGDYILGPTASIARTPVTGGGRPAPGPAPAPAEGAQWNTSEALGQPPGAMVARQFVGMPSALPARALTIPSRNWLRIEVNRPMTWRPTALMTIPLFYAPDDGGGGPPIVPIPVPPSPIAGQIAPNFPLTRAQSGGVAYLSHPGAWFLWNSDAVPIPGILEDASDPLAAMNNATGRAQVGYLATGAALPVQPANYIPLWNGGGTVGATIRSLAIAATGFHGSTTPYTPTPLADTGWQYVWVAPGGTPGIHSDGVWVPPGYGPVTFYPPALPGRELWARAMTQANLRVRYNITY